MYRVSSFQDDRQMKIITKSTEHYSRTRYTNRRQLFDFSITLTETFANLESFVRAIQVKPVIIVVVIRWEQHRYNELIHKRHLDEGCSYITLCTLIYDNIGLLGEAHNNS